MKRLRAARRGNVRGWVLVERCVLVEVAREHAFRALYARRRLVACRRCALWFLQPRVFIEAWRGSHWGCSEVESKHCSIEYGGDARR